MEECPEQVSNHAENFTRCLPSLDAEAVLLLGDLLEVGAACADPRSSGWSCWPQEAPLGEIKGNSCSRLGNSCAGRCGWPVGERGARLWVAPGQAAEELEVSHRAAGNCR